MSEETERNLLEWENNDRDTCDDLYAHFISFGRWDCTEISDEAVRVHNLMFGEDIEIGSPVAGVFSACAAQARDGVLAAVAAALGFDAEVLSLAIAEWYERQDNPPGPVSGIRLVELCQEEAKWLNELPSRLNK